VGSSVLRCLEPENKKGIVLFVVFVVSFVAVMFEAVGGRPQKFEAA
jgi:hypothetical protein